MHGFTQSVLSAEVLSLSIELEPNKSKTRRNVLSGVAYEVFTNLVTIFVSKKSCNYLTFVIFGEVNSTT